MFEYIDVTNDRAVERHAGLSANTVARAHEVGFADIGWVAAVGRPPPPAPPRADARDADMEEMDATSANNAPTTILVSRVMLHADGSTMLALTRTKGRDTVSLKTLFADGFIVSTEERPHGLAGVLVSRAISVAPRHAYDLATFPAPDSGMLFELHSRRVREAMEKTPSRIPVPGDLQVYIATRKRYREIANPRFEAHQKFASRFSWATFFVVAAAAFAFLAVLGVRGSSAVGAGFVAFLFAAVCGAGSFPFALIVLAPLLVKDADAPPPRSAEELIELGKDIRMGRVPVPTERVDDDDQDDDAPRMVARRAAATAEPLAPNVLARLRRLDAVIGISNSMLLPVVGFALMPALGSAGPTAALGSIASLDAVVLFIMKKSRGDLLRARFLPDLARVEGTADLVAPSWLRWVSLAVGVFALGAARRSIASGFEAAPQWLLVEWGFISVLFAFAAWRSIKRRHARFDASS